MTVILGIIIIILLMISIHKHRKYKEQTQELDYINKKIEAILGNKTEEYIRIPSENKEIKNLAMSVNHLLESYHQTNRENIHYKKKMTQVLTDISHDLKTPLTVLRGYSEMLLLKAQKKPINKELEVIIKKLDQKTGEVVHLVDQFFNIAKLESGDTVLNIKSININQICHEVMFEFYDLLEEINYEVHINIQDKPIYANVDEDAFKRILKNLIDNAIKYGGTGNFLEIHVFEEEKTVFLEIKDHGLGISKEECTLIFQRSYTSKNHKNQGSGLGLAISKSLIKVMGGNIFVRSKLGEGTTFVLQMIKSEEKMRFMREK